MLAPLNKPSKTLTGQQNRDKYISSKGLILPEQDILNTEEDGLVFDLFYSSKQEQSGSLGKGWQHSYTQKLTTSRNLSNANIKSSSYIKADQACLDGWDEIKASYYNGLLKNSLASYSAKNKLCEIKKPNSDILQTSLLIWQDNNQLASNAKVINLPTGESLVFIQNQTEKGTWQALGNPLKTLTKADTGWIYQDEQDKLEYFNLQGLLTKIAQQGIETKLTYQEGKLTDIKMPVSDQHINIEYANDDKILTIRNVITDKQVALFFDDQQRLATTELAGILVKNYLYNDRELLSKNTMLAKGNRIATMYEYDSNFNLISEDNNIEKAEQTSNIKKTKSTQKTEQDNTVIDAEILNDIPNEFKNKITYENGKIIYTDHQENKASLTNQLINDIDLITVKETEYSKQTFDYDENGNLIKITNEDANGNTTSLDSTGQSTTEETKNFMVEMTYNQQGQILTNEVFTEDNANDTSTGDTSDTNKPKRALTTRSVNGKKLTSAIRVEYAYQDKRCNSATAKKIADKLEFLTFNEKGQTTKTVTATLTPSAISTKSASQLSLKNLQPKDYQVVSTTSFTYNNLGLIASSKDQQGNTTKFAYHKNGKLSSTTLPNGKNIKKTPFKPSQYQLHDDSKLKSLTNYQKQNLPSILDPNKQTLFVEGFATNSVLKYKNEEILQINKKNWRYKRWHEVDFKITDVHNLTDYVQFLRRGVDVVIGHSYGADSALQFANNTAVDLVVTTDPVGHSFDRGRRAKIWLNVWADPGPAFSMAWKRFYICKCWCCKLYTDLYVPVSGWNSSDYIAFAGGKYSEKHRWSVNRYSDDSIKYKGHHGDFNQMINKINNKYLNIKLGVEEDYMCEWEYEGYC